MQVKFVILAIETCDGYLKMNEEEALLAGLVLWLENLEQNPGGALDHETDRSSGMGNAQFLAWDEPLMYNGIC